ncbi:hypothetical protein DIPPA_32282 [Diplonema papillatum]|nr:hypothetical protein DIPPA_32282 [Diplonema papillatum]|eukprot:gene20618-31761_t
MEMKGELWHAATDTRVMLHVDTREKSLTVTPAGQAEGERVEYASFSATSWFTHDVPTQPADGPWHCFVLDVKERATGETRSLAFSTKHSTEYREWEKFFGIVHRGPLSPAPLTPSSKRPSITSSSSSRPFEHRRCSSPFRFGLPDPENVLSSPVDDAASPLCPNCQQTRLEVRRLTKLNGHLNMYLEAKDKQLAESESALNDAREDGYRLQQSLRRAERKVQETTKEAKKLAKELRNLADVRSFGADGTAAAELKDKLDEKEREVQDLSFDAQTQVQEIASLQQALDSKAFANQVLSRKLQGSTATVEMLSAQVRQLQTTERDHLAEITKLRKTKRRRRQSQVSNAEAESAAALKSSFHAEESSEDDMTPDSETPPETDGSPPVQTPAKERVPSNKDMLARLASSKWILQAFGS